ncbi:MAG: glycosyltransferase [Clostridia bacterium]
MKIAMFTECYEPYINGVITHIKILTQGLRALGHEVMIVTGDTECLHHYVDKDNVLHCPAAKSGKRLYGYPISSPISRHRREIIQDFNPDIIHIHTEFSLGQSGIRLAKYLGVPMVYTMHTMYDEYVYYIAPKTLSRPATKLARQYLLFVSAHADAITGPSQKVAEYCKEIGVKKPVNVINNAAELDSFRPGAVEKSTVDELKNKLGIAPDETVAIFVGRLGREKSVDVLLGFWKETIRPEDKFKLVIIGEGPVKAELEQQTRDLGLTDSVIFAGKILHEDMPPYVAIGDVYVTASLSDTNSISMLEGMACGLPVLALTDPLNAGQVVDGVNGYSFNNAEEMGFYMRKIRDMSPEERAAFSDSVVKSVRSSGAEELAKKLLAVYTGTMTRETELTNAVKLLAMEYCEMNGFSKEKLTTQKVYRIYDKLIFATPCDDDTTETFDNEFFIKAKPTLVYHLDRGRFEFTEYAAELLK